MQAEFVANFKKPAVKVHLVIQGVLRVFSGGYSLKQENQTIVVSFCIGKGNQSRLLSENLRLFKVSSVLDANVNCRG
jgi:hypothetical protein